MKYWLKIDKVTIFNGKDENGNRYLSQFLRDYKETFNPDIINAGCDRCLEDYYQKFIKYLSTMSNEKPKNSGYVLREKYENMPLEFGSPILVNNSNLTDEMAEKMLKNPKGKELFVKIPEKKSSGSQSELTKLNRSELDEMAEKLGINPEDYSNKKEIAAAIEDVQNAKVESENQSENKDQE